MKSEVYRNETPEFDPQALERLRKIGGDKLINGILDIFLTQTPERLQTLYRAQRDQDWDTLHRTAHSLKSSAGNVGARWLQAAAETVEHLAQQSPADLTLHQLQQLEVLAKQAVARFTAVRKESPG